MNFVRIRSVCFIVGSGLMAWLIIMSLDDGFMKSSKSEPFKKAQRRVGQKHIQIPEDPDQLSNTWNGLAKTNMSKERLFAICADSPQEALEFLQESSMAAETKTQAVGLALKNLAKKNPQLATRYRKEFEAFFSKHTLIHSEEAGERK